MDAQPWGLSAQLFRAVVARRRGLGGQPAWGGVNDTWLADEGQGQEEEEEDVGKRACALGHVMNDPQGSAAGRPNVAFKVGFVRLVCGGLNERTLIDGLTD